MEHLQFLQRKTVGNGSVRQNELLIFSIEKRLDLGDGVVPNKRRTLSSAIRQFPGIDFSLVKNEKDVLFERYDTTDGETDIDIAIRSSRFSKFLLRRYTQPPISVLNFSQS